MTTGTGTHKSEKQPKFLAVDFYCGAGGTTRGLIDAGGYVIAGIDKDPVCQTTYQTNNPNSTLDCNVPDFIERDMFPATPTYPGGQQEEIKTRLRELTTRYTTMAPSVPLLFAICAPCQSFNKFVQPGITPNRRAARERDMNLLSEAAVFVGEFEPDIVLSENISGIENGRYGQVWANFKETLKALGYRIGSGQVCASRFGVAQRRRRSIILGVKARDEMRAQLELPVPTGNPATGEITVSDAIGSLDPLLPGEKHPEIANHECRNLSDINRRRLLAIEPGGRNFAFPPDLELPCHRRLAEKGNGKRGFGDVYTRLHPNRPAGTITTRFHSVSNGRFGHYDARQARGLSLHEGALLQSFPNSYVFMAPNADANARLIGNAVPPKLAEYLAGFLHRIWALEAQTEE